MAKKTPKKNTQTDPPRSPQAQSIAEAVKRLKTAEVHPRAGLYDLFLG